MRELKRKPKMLIHLSIISGIKELEPCLPECAIKGYEDDIIDRCCFSDNIDKCLSAIGAYYTTYYVYIALLKDNQKVYKPSKKEVFDSFLTDELWTIEPTKVICVGSIKVTKEIKRIPYKINQKPYICHFGVYDWIWKRKNKCWKKYFN